jgi:transcription termination factor Rho
MRGAVTCAAMNKTELESKHLAELHALAAEAGVERYRMLPRSELVAELADGNGGKPEDGERASRERPQRSRRERPGRQGGRERSGRQRQPRDRAPKEERKPEPAERKPAPEPAAAPAPTSAESESAHPRRKRRRRRFGRKSKGLRVYDLLTPPPGRQALVYGESRAACTALLREVAGELAGASEGPDPIALLIDPSPEELADWKREVPDAELVVAAQPRHASDALAQATRRAESGEDVILLVDSLTRLEDADTAKQIFDSALSQANEAKGTLTVVAALERQSS